MNNEVTGGKSTRFAPKRPTLSALFVSVFILTAGVFQVAPTGAGAQSQNIPVPPAVAQGPNLIPSSVAALAGTTAEIPITLNSPAGVGLDSLSFGLRISPRGGAPDLTGALSFVQDNAMAAPTLLDTGLGPQVIAVSWLGLSSPLTGNLVLGTVQVTVPLTATMGQSYTIEMTGLSGTQGTTVVPLALGRDATLTVGGAIASSQAFPAPAGNVGGVGVSALNHAYLGPDLAKIAPATAAATPGSYLVGDAAPLLTDLNGDGDTDDASEFGDGVLNNLDLISALRAVTNIPGFRPLACKDRFDAMDSFPLDTATARGGDGVLNNQDLIATLRRVVNIDTSRPQRTSRGLTCGVAVVSVINPNSGLQGQQNLSVSITGQFTNFVQGTTTASFGPGITVASLTVSSSTAATAVLNIDPAAAAGTRTVTLTTGSEVATLTNGFTVNALPSPAITDFNPKSGPVGTLINVTGNNFVPIAGAVPQVTLNKQGGGTLAAALSSFTNTTLAFVIPTGADSGPLTVTTIGQIAISTSALTITAPSNFTLTASPASASLIQGQSASYTLILSSTNGFNQLAPLNVSGLPTGVTGSFKPTQITAGQTSVLTVTAPVGQALGPTTLTFSASATVNGIPLSQTATAQLNVVAPTTSFIGRTVVQDPVETSLAGVTVSMLGKDGNGGTTGCTGTTVSDAAGNFALQNLSPSCTGPQLVGFDGTTAISPPGKYAGVNLVYTLVSGQVTVSPVLVHLPRIDNVETFLVQQNSSTDQTYSFKSIPRLSVTVYAGTTFTMPNGTQPNPFPLAAVQVPVDRLPDLKPPVPTMLNVFIVAFQPANVTANQPVAVYYPNVLNTAPGTNMPLLTLDPTHGAMIPYGTGTVSTDGTQVVPDPDPAHPGHLYGIVHFDWHGGMPPPPPEPNPCDSPPCPIGGGPVDFSSGLEVATHVDFAIPGRRGTLAMVRTFRQASTTSQGPFGIGTSHNYGYGVDNISPSGATIINLTTPDGNRIPFSGPLGGPFVNTTVPSMLGAVMKGNIDRSVDLRLKDGTTYHFFGGTLATGSLLTSITDSNGNVITLTRPNLNSPQITQISDPVGRILSLSYDSSNRITSITDPLGGRTVFYSYNSQGTLATFTDPAGGVSTHTYDSLNNLTQVTDPRGVIIVQNTYDANSRVVKQVEGDGGALSFAYTLVNPLVTSSPVLMTSVTDPLGNVTKYHFDPNGNLLDVTDPAGQMRVFTLGANNLITAITGNGSCGMCGNPSAGNQNFTYDANGNMLTQTDALGNTTTYTYEPVHNKVTSITDSLGNVTTFTYDANGNQTAATNPLGNSTRFAYNTFGQPTTATNALGNAATFSYNAQGDPATATDSNGNTATTTYDHVSHFVGQVFPKGRTGSFSYDVLDRPTTMVDPLGGTISFSYDRDSNILSVTDPKSNTTTYTYDNLNRVSRHVDPLGNAESFVYDKNGNTTSVTDRNGQTTTNTYDALNRRTSATYADGSKVQFQYDAAGRLVQITDTADPHGPILRSYDADGRLTSETTALGSVSYQLDSLGRRIQITVSGQPPVTYSYDSDSRLVSLTQSGLSPAMIQYDALNRRTQLTLPNGVSTAYQYDANSFLTALTYSNTSGPLGNLTYQYDASGNLTAVGGTLARTLLPDAVATASYDAANHQLSLGSKTMTYDHNGNVTSLTDSTGVTNFTWDARNRLIGINGPTVSASFQYDAVGRRASATINGTKTEFLYDMNNVVEEFNKGAVSATYLGSLATDEPFLRHSSINEYYLADGLGSILALTDDHGAVLTSYTYDPFGRSAASGLSSTNRFQYSTRENDGTGFYYYRARYYSPQLHRFLDEDPIGLITGARNPNLNAYDLNNPNRFRDPLGLQVGGGIGVHYGQDVANDVVGDLARHAIEAEGTSPLSVFTGNALTLLAASEQLGEGVNAIYEHKELLKNIQDDLNHQRDVPCTGAGPFCGPPDPGPNPPGPPGPGPGPGPGGGGPGGGGPGGGGPGGGGPGGGKP